MQIGYRSGSRHLGVSVHREAPGRFTVTVDETSHGVEAALLDSTTIQLVIGGVSQVAHVVRLGGTTHVWIAGELHQLQAEAAGGSAEHVVHLQPQVLAPMPGKVLQVLIAAGQTVATGDGLVIVEAMKMEHRIVAPAKATVVRVQVKPGDQVDFGTQLVSLKLDGAS